VAILAAQQEKMTRGRFTASSRLLIAATEAIAAMLGVRAISVPMDTRKIEKSAQAEVITDAIQLSEIAKLHAKSLRILVMAGGISLLLDRLRLSVLHGGVMAVQYVILHHRIASIGVTRFPMVVGWIQTTLAMFSMVALIALSVVAQSVQRRPLPQLQFSIAAIQEVRARSAQMVIIQTRVVLARAIIVATPLNQSAKLRAKTNTLTKVFNGGILIFHRSTFLCAQSGIAMRVLIAYPPQALALIGVTRNLSVVGYILTELATSLKAARSVSSAVEM